jgi:hypothetical protein
MTAATSIAENADTGESTEMSRAVGSCEVPLLEETIGANLDRISDLWPDGDALVEHWTAGAGPTAGSAWTSSRSG